MHKQIVAAHLSHWLIRTGLIYHASLIGQAAPKNKGKIARVLAAKCSLAVRVDALGEGDDASLGIDARSKVEARLRQLEGGSVRASAPNGAPKKLIEVVQSGNGAAGYSAASDMVLSDKKKKKDKKKRDREESPDEAAAKKARKAEKKARKLAEAAAAGGDGEKPKKKKKKSKD